MTPAPAKPLGDDHLELRAALGTGMYSLMAIARDAGVLTPQLEQLRKLSSDLRGPFTFMVAGEVKAGKSTLLNALFGREVCRADALPATDRIHQFRFGLATADHESGTTLIEHYRPMNFLRDFQLVDTPGVNSTDARHNEIAAEFVPLADVVLFVFPVTNPWSASSWDFLEKIQRRWLRRVVLVVQQIDLRDSSEVDAITVHLRKMCHERLKDDVPIFAVSAKQALEVKTTEGPHDGLWEKSGFGPLERTVNQLLISDPHRFERMLRSVRLAQMELPPLAEKAGFALSLFESDRHELARATREMYDRLSSQRSVVEALQGDIDRALARCWNRGVQMLEERLSPLRAMKFTWASDTAWKGMFRAALTPAVQSTLAKQVDQALARIDEEMRNARLQFAGLIDAWVQLGPHPNPATKGDDVVRRRAQKLGDLSDVIEASLRPESAETEMRGALAEAAGDRFLRNTTPGISFAAALTERLTQLAVHSASEALEEIPGGLGLSAVGRSKQIVDAYQVAMTDRGETMARAIRSLFARLVECSHDRLMRVLAPYEEFGQVEERRWQQIARQVEELGENLGSIRTRIEGRRRS